MPTPSPVPVAEVKSASPAAEVAAEEASIDAQIQTAVELGKKADAVNKGKDTKLAKKVEKAAVAKAAPAKADEEELPANPPPDDAEDDTEAEQELEKKGFRPLSKQRLREMIDAGDVDGAFEAAFGQKPSDFGINSKRWEEWRKANKRTKQGLAEYHQKLSGAATQLTQEFKPLIEARKLAEAGDAAGAIKAAFGWDASEFNKLLIRSMHGQAQRDPAVDKLERELQAMRAERQQERDQYQAQLQQQELAKQQADYKKTITGEIAESGDPQLERFAKKPNFIEHVLTILRQHYDHGSRTTIPVVEAADMARQAILDEFGDVFGESRDADESAASVRGGSIPAKAAGKPAKTLSQRGAAEASAPLKNGKQMSADELADYFAEQHRASNGKTPMRHRA